MCERILSFCFLQRKCRGHGCIVQVLGHASLLAIGRVGKHDIFDVRTDVDVAVTLQDILLLNL